MQRLLLLTVFVICSSFTLLAQIPEGYYDLANGLSGEELKSALNTIIKGQTEFPYTSSSTDVWDILKESDKDTTNPDNVILFYTGWSVNAEQEYNNGSGWNREHVWAKSRGDFGTSLGPVTDALFVKFNIDMTKEFWIEIQDVTGRVISLEQKKEVFPGDVIQLNTSTFSYGVYFLRVYTPDREQSQILSITKL